MISAVGAVAHREGVDRAEDGEQGEDGKQDHDPYVRLAVLAGRAPSAERRLVHRDYHPGNVLIGGGAVAGVVDWPNASIGPPAADVGHCRANLAGAISQHAADRFLELWPAAGDYHPYWDIAAALGGHAEEDLEEAWTARDEDFLTRAVAAL